MATLRRLSLAKSERHIIHSCDALRLIFTNGRLNITFVDKDGSEHNFAVSEGDNLLDIAQHEEMEMEGRDPHVLSLYWLYIASKLITG